MQPDSLPNKNKNVNTDLIFHDLGSDTKKYTIYKHFKLNCVNFLQLE